MNNAKTISCPIICNPDPKDYDEKSREFQGCPTIAVTKKGRIFTGWYAGGFTEPHMNNYNLMHYSDDNANTWSDICLAIPSSKKDLIHALDIQLWIDPENVLHVFWVQNNVERAPQYDSPEYYGKKIPDEDGSGAYVDGYYHADKEHAEWEIICENPDADELVFSEPRFVFTGFLRCKPNILSNGAYLYFNYNQLCDKYAYSISYDKGKTFTSCYGGKKIDTPFDETMAYQMDDSTVRMLARAANGFLAQSLSKDNGITWTDGESTDILNPSTRFYVEKLPSGRVLLVNNDCSTERKRMTAYLSEDDGLTWKYKNCINAEEHTTYPDVAIHNGTIYLVYDHERTKAKEIILCKFTEEDIINNSPITEHIISKAYGKLNI